MPKPKKAARKGGKPKKVEAVDAETTVNQDRLNQTAQELDSSQDHEQAMAQAPAEPNPTPEEAQKYEAEAIDLLVKAGWTLLQDAKIEDSRGGPDGRWTFRNEGRYSQVLVKK